MIPNTAAPALIYRDPSALLARTLAQWGGGADLWVYAYGSLIWRPECDAAEERPALAYGWHRAFRMRSRVNRGTPETPGLVFALMAGGSCRGLVHRWPGRCAAEQLETLWKREMVTGIYDPRWITCLTPQGPVTALAFTLSRQSPGFVGGLNDPSLLAILRDAKGRFGSTLDYLVETARALRARGIRDREVERLLALAQRHGLVHGPD